MGPLGRAAAAFLEKDRAPFHMPGHKGRALFPLGQAARWDLTEVEGCDSLYEAEGAIAETEAAYRRLYGTAASLLSAGGSTLCIQTMLALAVPTGSVLLAGRGVHTAAVNAMALLGLSPRWLYPEAGDEGLMGCITPETVAQGFREHPEAAAIYLTCPNYYGVLCDLPAIAEICHSHGVPLLVDDAHGAHLKFLPQSLHPMDRGADLCADSLHKTLPVLTGGALLHIKNPDYVRRAKARMALFGSTSPSYLVLLSADGALPYLEGDVRTDLARVCGEIAALRAAAGEAGYAQPRGDLDPVRLTVGFGAMGHTRESFDSHIRGCGIEPEYLGDRFCVFLGSPRTTGEDLDRLRKALLSLPRQAPLPSLSPPLPQPEQVCSLGEAVFADTLSVPVEGATGRIAGSAVAPCPPGIPLALPGERIDGNLAGLLKEYGISWVNVLQ